MPRIRLARDVTMGYQGIGIEPLSGSPPFDLSPLKPYLWIKANDAPASSTLLDYGVYKSPGPPQFPPHNMAYPANNSQITPGWTNDGIPGMQWDGTHAEQAAYIAPGGAPDDLPQGTSWTFLVAAKIPSGGGGYPFCCCAGLGIDSDGKSGFGFQLGGSAGDGKIVTQTNYDGGTNAFHTTSDSRATDDAWHFYALNVYPVAGVGHPTAATMQYDLYIDGSAVDSFTINSGGFSFFYDGSTAGSIPDAFRIGGWPSWGGATNISKGAVQHFAIFIGGTYSEFGPMLTAAQIAALNAAR